MGDVKLDAGQESKDEDKELNAGPALGPLEDLSKYPRARNSYDTEVVAKAY